MSLEKAMHKQNHSARDFYQTPELCVEAIIPYIGQSEVWDPCCGDGAIGNVLKRHSIPVVETDLYSGPKHLRRDFLLTGDAKKCDVIVMNPPFARKKEFIIHAIKKADYVFCILSMQVVNYNDFSREILTLPEYRGRIKMVPKFFMTEDPQPGIPKTGGNAQYAWFLFSKIGWKDFSQSGISFEKQVDLLEETND